MGLSKMALFGSFSLCVTRPNGLRPGGLCVLLCDPLWFNELIFTTKVHKGYH